jgi:hypothetical protein
MASSKTKNDDRGLPPALAAAVGEAEIVLARHDKLASVLAETGASISASLAQERELTGRLGQAEITGDGVAALRTELSTIVERRQADVRRRQASASGLLGLGTELARARSEVDKARSEYAGTVVAGFESRWARACQELAVLQAEAQQLTTALRCLVTCQLPFVAALNVVRDRPEVRYTGKPAAPPPLPAPVATVTGALDRLDSARALVGAVQQSIDQDARHHALARHRTGMADQMTGVFVVTKAFEHLGSQFLPGALVTRAIVSDGALFRLQLARCVLLDDFNTADAA